MQNRNIQVILITIILIIPSLIFIQENDVPKNDAEGSDLQLSDNYLDQTDEKMICNSRSAGLSREDMAHGGYWMDDFIDNSKIDSTLSHDIAVNPNNVKLRFKQYGVDSITQGLWHLMRDQEPPPMI